MLYKYFCWNIMMQRNRSNLMKVFFDHETIILKLWKTKLEKLSSCAFYLIIAPRYFLEHITVLKSHCQFYKWSSVTFQKNESLSARKEKLVPEASHVNSMKNAACKKKNVGSLWTYRVISNNLLWFSWHIYMVFK